jgi:hypothetical protein
MTNMAKGQQRSNREAKKPKKDKTAAAPASPNAAWLTVEKLQARENPAQRKK